MPISVVLADDHPLVLDGLQLLFSQAPDFIVVARCSDGEATLAAVRVHQPDLLILDLRIPGKDGLAVLRELADMHTPTRVIVLTAALDEDDTMQAIQLGVRGIVLKEMASEMLLRCARKVHAGGQWLEWEAAARALGKLLARETESDVITRLTPRELEIVRLVVARLRNKEIGRRLAISEGTVKIHIHSIYGKLGVTSRFELAAHVRDRGFV